ncbi:MAG: response regulator [Candidatus Pacebacteria bacterium]|nr:response regulator [Candidatus Paceibacterota bacterium]NUQ57144.1 response regulator [Candidatus Paceibacter sp.]
MEKRKILIIDDDEFLLEMYAAKFKEEDFEVEIARSAKDALAKIKNGLDPGLILLDVVMPGMDGFEFMENLRKEKLAAKSKIIVLSNLGQKNQTDKAMELGAVDFVVKAYFTPSEVVKKVNSLTGAAIKQNKNQ